MVDRVGERSEQIYWPIFEIETIQSEPNISKYSSSDALPAPGNCFNFAENMNKL